MNSQRIKCSLFTSQMLELPNVPLFPSFPKILRIRNDSILNFIYIFLRTLVNLVFTIFSKIEEFNIIFLFLLLGQLILFMQFLFFINQTVGITVEPLWKYLLNRNICIYDTTNYVIEIVYTFINIL